MVFEFLYENEMLYDYYFEFRSEHSTQQTLTTLVNRVTTFFGRSNIAISLFIGLKKAFDKVHHQLL